MKKLIKIRNAGGGICLKKRKNGKNGKKIVEWLNFEKEYAIIRLYIHTQIYTFGVPEKCGFWKIQNLKNCVAEIWKGEKPL